MAETQITVTEVGEQTLRSMRQQVFEVEENFGRGSPEHIEAMQSLLNVLLDIFRLGGRISKDGDLSLYVVSFIHYGVIFHRRYEGDNRFHPLLGEWSIHS